MNLIDKIMQWKFITWGLCGNRWVWFHILAAGVGARIGLIWFDKLVVFLAMVILILLWEVFEFVIETKGNPKKVYGSIERWAWDTAGDILGAIACVLLVLSV